MIEYFPLLNEAPFRVSPAEVASYYGPNHTIEHVEQPSLPEHGMVRKFNLEYLKEHGFLLTKMGEVRDN